MKIIWNKINWANYNFIVFDLQCKIFNSSRREKNFKIETRILQKQLLNTQEAKAVAIRKVTQDNRKKITAGIDGIKNLTSIERVALLRGMQLDGSVSPICKGVFTIEDRAKQALIHLALEPEWEAVFETNSYGNRPGYCAADAKWVVTRQLQGAPKFILDADIKNCFENINHDYLLSKLKQSRMISMQIKSWLETGILTKDEEDISENILGIPKDGFLSPLLLNIALHGMENKIKEKFGSKLKLIRYTDNFLVIGKELNDVENSKAVIESFLKPIGLELSEKTIVKHSMNVFEGRSPGTDFVGFHFKNVACSVHRGVKSTQGVCQPFRQQCFPSKESVQKHKINLKSVIKKYKNVPLEVFIGSLSSIIQGWTKYFSVSQSTKTFSEIDGWLFKKLWKWSVKRHKSAAAAKEKCWSIDGWKFGFKDKDKIFILKRHDQTPVKNHIKIQANASIYDGNLLYFAKRIVSRNSRISKLNGLFKKQEYKCKICNFYFKPTDLIEIHHEKSNEVRTGKIQLVHNFCHDLVHGENS